MQRFLTLTLALFIGLSFSFDAQARRFGGGKSLGAPAKHRPAQQRQQQQQQPKQQPDQKNTTGAGRLGLGGALMGLAAGGLLASMLFGEVFEGFKLFDLLIVGGIAFLLYKLLLARRQPSLQTAAAGAPPTQREMNTDLLGSQTNASVAPVMQAPSWFDEQRFVAQAREHFMQLQQLWDANDFSQIAQYLTPEMLIYLEKERASLGEGYQSTYIEQLQVNLDGIEELNDYTVATLSFTGVAKTSRFEQGNAFHESWRMERAHGDNQPWLIAGIEQHTL